MSKGKKDLKNNYSRYRINGDIEVLQGSFTSRSFKPHFHDTYALILVESGVADYGYRQQSNIVTDNKLLVLNPYEVHTGRSLGEGVWNFRSMYLPKDLVRSNYNVDKELHPNFVNKLIQNHKFLKRYQLLHNQMLENDLSIDDETELSDLLLELAKLSGLDYPEELSDGYTIVADLF